MGTKVRRTHDYASIAVVQTISWSILNIFAFAELKIHFHCTSTGEEIQSPYVTVFSNFQFLQLLQIPLKYSFGDQKTQKSVSKTELMAE